jgi:dihydroorotate dehydrogenase (NAD+) catalytic subunit
MTVAVGRVTLEHPVVNGSGTLDALAAEAAGLHVAAELAAVVTKTVTPLPRAGNPPPRIAETPAGMLNSIGLANPGIDAFRSTVLPRMRALGRPLVVSIGGFAPNQYASLAAALRDEDGIVALELNVSCPNVESGCLSIGSDPNETRSVTARCAEAAGDLPVWVKLSPNVADVGVMARAAEEGGADALVAVNTLRGAAFDRASGAPLLGGPGGGLSGPAVRPVALSAVAACRAATSLPIVGSGGVGSGQDALAFLDAGASAVAVGTAAFREPLLARRVREELAGLLAAGAGRPSRAESRARSAQPSTAA